MSSEMIAPTKSNLMRVKERLTIAREGYDLLEQKREILVMELMRRLEKVKILEHEVTEKTSGAYPLLKRLLVVHGRQNLAGVTAAIRYDFDIRPVTARIAGLTIPALETALPKPELKYAPQLSGAEYDETALAFFDTLKTLTTLAAERAVVWRLAREVRRTQRRVNALEKMVIPAAESAKVFIESALEEKDRDSFFSAKLLKRKKTQGKTDD